MQQQQHKNSPAIAKRPRCSVG